MYYALSKIDTMWPRSRFEVKISQVPEPILVVAVRVATTVLYSTYFEDEYASGEQLEYPVNYFGSPDPDDEFVHSRPVFQLFQLKDRTEISRGLLAWLSEQGINTMDDVLKLNLLYGRFSLVGIPNKKSDRVLQRSLDGSFGVKGLCLSLKSDDVLVTYGEMAENRWYDKVSNALPEVSDIALSAVAERIRKILKFEGGHGLES